MEETQKQEQSAATIVAEKSASVEDNEFFDANQETDDHDNDDDDDDGKLVSKDTMETQDSENGDTDVDASKSLAKKTRGKKKKKDSQRQTQSGLSNTLTKLLPGYVAPMKLAAPSLDRYRALPLQARGGGRGEDAASPASLVAGLDALRRKAVQQEFQTTSSTRTNSLKYSMQHHAQVMLQKPTASSSSTTSYVNTHASFKRGSKRPPVNHAGEGWFDMQATPMTAELERDLLLIRNRNYLDPKRFYKSADNKKKPSKFVQAGTVIEGAAEFYSSRLVKRQRRGNLVEEIMAESSSLSNCKQPSNNGTYNGNSGGAGTAGSSADYVMKKYKTMQTERTTKAQAWHKRNDSKGRRRPQRK